MDLKENEEGFVGGYGVKNEKGEMLYWYCNLKNVNIKNKFKNSKIILASMYRQVDKQTFWVAACPVENLHTARRSSC